MKDVTDIFLINEEGILVVNKPEIRNIKEFKAILTRDKGGKVSGDHEGRKKMYAFKELMYIHLYTHPLSIYRDLPDEVKHLKCIEDTGLSKNWKIDKVIKEAQYRYVKLLNMSALYNSYINANKGVYSLGEDLRFFNTLRDKTRNKIIDKSKELEQTIIDEDTQRLTKEIDNATNRLMELGNKITTLSNSLPVAFETVEKLKQKLLKESEVGGAIYGGGKLNNREA